MKVVNVPVDFGVDHSGASDWKNITATVSDRISFSFTAPISDSSFDLFAGHAADSPAVARTIVLSAREDNYDPRSADAIWSNRSMTQVDVRMYTTDLPGNRRANIRLTGGKKYYVNVECNDQSRPDAKANMVWCESNG